MLTLEEIRSALPQRLRGAASEALVDRVNAAAGNPEDAEVIAKNFVGYAYVLQEGRWRVADYLNAVVYVSHKLLGKSNREAYALTFPERYANLAARGLNEKEIASYVSHYNKTQLVNAILEQTLVPSWVLNQDVYQKAINVQAELMLTANSEKVRAEAANSLLTHLKRPEAVKHQVALEVKEPEGMNELKEMLGQMAKSQLELIEAGVPTQEIARQKLPTAREGGTSGSRPERHRRCGTHGRVRRSGVNGARIFSERGSLDQSRAA